jgi:hypothetical protein
MDLQKAGFRGNFVCITQLIDRASGGLCACLWLPDSH